MIKQNYKLIKVVCVRKTPAHYPYIAYAVIMSPRGKETLIDLFNLELILYSRFNAYGPIRFEQIVMNWAAYHGMLETVGEIDNSDFGLKMIAVENHWDFIIRKGNRTNFYKMQSRLDLSSLAAFINTSMEGVSC